MRCTTCAKLAIAIFAAGHASEQEALEVPHDLRQPRNLHVGVGVLAPNRLGVSQKSESSEAIAINDMSTQKSLAPVSSRRHVAFMHQGDSGLRMANAHVANQKVDGHREAGWATGWWILITLFVIAFAFAMFLYYGSHAAERVRNKDQIQGYSPPVQNWRSPPPSRAPPPGEALVASMMRQSLAAEPLTPAQAQTMPTKFKPTHASQVKPPGDSLPPRLWLQILPSASQTSFSVSTVSLLQLYDRQAVQIQSHSDKSIVHARLVRCFEGSRLEVSPSPSFGDFSSVGPLDYPASLGNEASVHGPGREYYGPFQRSQQGFVVGHYSRGGNPVFVLMIKQAFVGGAYVEIKAGSTVIATTQSIANGYQINVYPGVDALLIVTSIIAAFVASQALIDETGTTI